VVEVRNPFLWIIKCRFIAMMILFLGISNFLSAKSADPKNVIDSLKKELNRNSGDDLQKFKIFNSLSVSYRKISPDSSMHYAAKALELAKKMKSEKQKGDALQNLGIAYFYAHDFKKSLDYLYQSLNIREKMTDSKKIAHTLNSIGNVYYNLNNVSEALKFYKRALSLARKLGDQKREASILNNMGSLYGSNNRVDTAYILLNQSVALLESQNDSPSLSSSYNNLALLYRKNGAYEKSLKYDQKSLKINKEIGRNWEISYISNSIGETYLVMKNYQKAFEYFNDALRAAETLQNQDILLFSYRSMTKYYSAVGNYEQFDIYFNKYEATKDAIFTTQNTNSIAEMQVKYETERKEKENALQKLQIAKERTLKNTFIYLSLLVLVVVIILFFRFRVKKKLSAKLEILVNKRTHDLLVNQSKLTEAQRIGKSGSWDWDFVNDQLSWSDELPIILGRTNKDMSWITILRSIHEDDRPKILKIFRKNFTAFDSHLVFDFRIVANNIIEKYISVYAELTKDNLGKISLMQGNIQDITERKLAELALIESEQLYRKLISASPDAVFKINADGLIVFASQQSKKLFRISDEKVIVGTHINEWIVKTDQLRVIENLTSQTSEKRSSDTDVILQRKDGSTFSGELRTAIISDADGKSKGLIVVVRNITDRKEMEQRILRNTIETEERERQRFSEDLHDGLGPLLSTAKIYLELVAARMEKPTEQKEFIKMTDDLLHESIKSTREIANNLAPNLLSDFGLIEALSVYVEKINKMNTISVTLKIEENFPNLPKQTEVALYRIISELLNNTLKHASASTIEIDFLKMQREVQITYSDNGIGCDIQKMLSSPSKGLGLSNITSRVKSINGHCTFKSVPGQYFRTNITLLLAEQHEQSIRQTF
jgi:PAS domain S-box-containing protein